jgi:hypothetical protein
MSMANKTAHKKQSHSSLARPAVDWKKSKITEEDRDLRYSHELDVYALVVEEWSRPDSFSVCLWKIYDKIIDTCSAKGVSYEDVRPEVIWMAIATGPFNDMLVEQAAALLIYQGYNGDVTAIPILQAREIIPSNISRERITSWLEEIPKGWRQ